MSQYHPLPQPDEIPTREKEDAMGSYLMMFAAAGAGLPLPIINLIAAVIYYYVNRGKSRFVKFHSLQSVISQLPTTVINAITVFWIIRLIINQWEVTNTFWGWVAMAVVANLLYFIFSIIAAVKARKGQFYYFLFFGRLSYHYAYQIKEGEGDGAPVSPVNRPPAG